MNNLKDKYIAVIAVMLLALSGIAGGRSGDVDSDSRAKADYIFLSLPDIMENGELVDYYEFANRAYELNPGDTTLGFYSGLMNIVFSTDDSIAFEKALQQIEDYVLANPDDLSNAQVYANILRRYDKVERHAELWAMFHKFYPTRPEITFYYAKSLSMAERYEEAIGLLDSLELSSGPGLGLSSHKMQIMLMMGDTARILSELHHLLESGPEVVENLIFAGDVHVDLEMADSAKQYYDRAYEIDPTDGQVCFSRANYYNEIGDSVAYNREVMTAIKYPEVDPEAKVEIMRGFIYNYMGDSLMNEHISGLMDTLIEMHPHNADLHVLYSQYLATRTDFEEAAIQMSYANDISPGNSGLWNSNIVLWKGAGNNEEAIKTGEKALKYFPEDLDLLLQVAGLYASVDTTAAMGYLKTALGLVGESDSYGRSAVYTAMGDVYSSIDSIKQAMPYYQMAINADPENSLALNNMAYFIALTGGDLDEAETMVRKSLDLSPDNVNALDTYAWVLFKKKEYKYAKTEIDRALEAEVTPSADLYEHAGDIYFMNGLPDEALEYWEKALEMNPENKLLAKKVKNKAYFFE